MTFIAYLPGSVVVFGYLKLMYKSQVCNGYIRVRLSEIIRAVNNCVEEGFALFTKKFKIPEKTIKI